MEKIADKIIRYAISKGEIKEEDYCIYKYGMQTGMEALICLFAGVAIAIYLKSFIEFCIFVIIFFPLRTYVGGVHLKTYLECFFCSCGVITIVLYGSKFLKISQDISFIVMVMELGIIYRLAPITTKEKTLDKEEAAFYSKQRLKILIWILIIFCFFLLLKLLQYSSLIMCTMGLVLSSMLIEIVKNLRQDKSLREN